MQGCIYQKIVFPDCLLRSIAWSSQETERLEEVDLDCILCRKYYTSMEAVSYTHLYIRWQDVLAVFSSYVAGSEQGAPVAARTEDVYKRQAITTKPCSPPSVRA